MQYHAYEQANGAARHHVASWDTAQQAADWLKTRSQQIAPADMHKLQNQNPPVRAYFAQERLRSGQPVTWTVGNLNPHQLIVEPHGHQQPPNTPH